VSKDTFEGHGVFAIEELPTSGSIWVSFYDAASGALLIHGEGKSADKLSWKATNP
jgi:hypothetical protein